MNKDQGTGIVERVVYGLVTFLTLRYGPSLGLTADDAAWIGAGLITFGGGAFAWWHNRPVSILNRASAALPDNTKLIISPAPSATPTEKAEAKALATAANDKITAK